MPGLNGEDGGGGDEDIWVINENGTAQIGSDTHCLDDSGNRGHGCDINEDGVEVEYAA